MHSESQMSFMIRPVQNEQEMDKVYRLVHDVYLRRGYCTPQPDRRLRHYRHFDEIPETTVLIAIEDGKIIGTNSLTVDGPNGLPVDADFKHIVDTVRQEKHKLGASWRIATIHRYHNDKKLVIALIQETVSLVIRKNIRTMLFTFNPRHQKVYKRILGMKTLSQKINNVECLKNAPAVLMRWDIERCPDRWLHTEEEKAAKLAAVKSAVYMPVINF
jgi:hypothetical protein